MRMEYRNVKQIEARPSLLGFGCMRFPTLEGGAIDKVQSTAMIDRAYQAGVNYFDTAYFYHDGESEKFTNQALAAYPRESYYLTSKLPTTLVHSLDDAKRLFAEQMERLQRDYLDFYLLHNLNGYRWREMVKLGVVDWCLDLQRQGVIRRLGFSFHGTYKAFEEILRARNWDCCQIQLNYMDTEEQAGIKGYRLTEELGVPLIIMEPVKGGALANPPAEVMELFESRNPGATASSWALRWAASLPNVMTVLSGMSAMEQVDDNLNTFTEFKPLDAQEEVVLVQAAEQFNKRMKNGCTGCKYCMPCPAGVNIPGNFKVWNEWSMFSNHERAKTKWKETAPAARPSQCIGCGACEENCPQGLDIRGDLQRMQADMESLGK